MREQQLVAGAGGLPVGGGVEHGQETSHTDTTDLQEVTAPALSA